MKQKYFYSILLLFLGLLGFSQTLDQQNAPASIGGGSFTVSPSQDVGQSFTAGMTGDLSQINIRVGNWGSIFVAGDFQLRIIDGNGYGGTVLNTTTFSIPSAPVTSNYDELAIALSATVPITSGNMYTIDLKGTTGTVSTHGANPDYANGGLYFASGNNALYDGYDLWFKTFVNVPTPATHLNFDGVDDYVQLSTTPTAIPSGNSTYTLEAWMNPSQIGVKGIIGWGTYGTVSQVNAFRLSPTGLNHYWWANDLEVTYTFTTGTWYHLAATFDGTTRKIYINGVLVAQDTPTGHNVTTTNNVTIGRTWNSEYFSGSIDDVRIWNVARNIQQINGSMNCELQGTEAGLIAYYQFNQGVDQADNTSITTLTDATSNGNDGTLTNFTLNSSTSNWLAGSPITTGSVIPTTPIVTTPVTYNQNDSASALIATTGGTGLLWYAAETGGTGSTSAPTPDTSTAGSTSYWVSSTNANGCESERVEIVVTVNAPTEAPTTTWATQVYTGDDKTLADLQVTGSNIIWYDSPAAGSVLATTTSLSDETTYYASQTIASVESTDRLAITVNRISDNTQILPPASTVADLVTAPSTGTTAQWFANASGGTALSGTDVLTNGVYYVEQQTAASVETLGSGFLNPGGVAIQADGKIVVADSGNTAIKRMDNDGNNIETLGSGFFGPYQLAIQADGKILMFDLEFDYMTSNIKRMDADGTNIETLASFIQPGGLAIQADGKIVVADYDTTSIKRMDTDGTNIVTLANGFASLSGVAIQTDGKIVFADENTIKRIDSDGSNNVTLASSGLSGPTGVAIQADGKIVIGNYADNTIKRMDADGSNIVTLASGIAIPNQVAIQADGGILVADSGNNAIKRITEASTSNRVPVNVDVTTLGTSNFDVNSFKIYPNPSDGIYTITCKEELTITVYDIVGKVIKTQTINNGNNILDISSYNAGVYFLNAVNTQGETKTFKLIKN